MEQGGEKIKGETAVNWQLGYETPKPKVSRWAKVEMTVYRVVRRLIFASGVGLWSGGLGVCIRESGKPTPGDFAITIFAIFLGGVMAAFCWPTREIARPS